jgi:hypothetical protein
MLSSVPILMTEMFSKAGVARRHPELMTSSEQRLIALEQRLSGAVVKRSWLHSMYERAQLDPLNRLCVPPHRQPRLECGLAAVVDVRTNVDDDEKVVVNCNSRDVVGSKLNTASRKLEGFAGDVLEPLGYSPVSTINVNGVQRTTYSDVRGARVTIDEVIDGGGVSSSSSSSSSVAQSTPVARVLNGVVLLNHDEHDSVGGTPVSVTRDVLQGKLPPLSGVRPRVDTR